MRGRLLAGAAVGVALLLAALAAVESVSERQPAADLAEPAAMPAEVTVPPSEELPSAPELSESEAFAGPMFTR